MTGEADTSSVTQVTHTRAPPLTDVSPASVLSLTRITEDYLCPPQARYASERVDFDLKFKLISSGKYLWYRLHTFQDT